jgi:hypothetical protein
MEQQIRYCTGSDGVRIACATAAVRAFLLDEALPD